MLLGIEEEIPLSFYFLISKITLTYSQNHLSSPKDNIKGELILLTQTQKLIVMDNLKILQAMLLLAKSLNYSKSYK
jgi:hypothetical protein